MRAYSLKHLSDQDLIRGLDSIVARDRGTTAEMLAHIAEVDERKLYLPAGYPSMYAYCVERLRLSEDAAYKRIQAARAAQRFPLIFEMVADGRLNLTGVGLLAPHLAPGNVGELTAAAAGKRKLEIEELLARRFPRSESLPMVVAIPSVARQLAPAQVGPPTLGPAAQLAPAQVGAATVQTAQLAPGRVEPRAKMTPIAADRFALNVSIAGSTRDKLSRIRALLGHAVPSGDLAEVLDRAFDLAIGQLEKRKFAATSKPRPRRERKSKNPRHIPAHVKRAVWKRDEGQCTFVGENGHRCSARGGIEYDHAEPIASGGLPTVENLRLRCRAHNQLEAERAFGAGFMARKREEARAAAAEARRARSSPPSHEPAA